MSAPTPIDASPHILELLSRLHQTSLDQEAKISKSGKVFSHTVRGDLEDKCHFMYQLIHAIGATNVIEAGTSFGVSTIYLALAVSQVKAATGKSGTVIATEKEFEKAQIARQYWEQCGAAVQSEIDLRVGDLLETLKSGLPKVDLLLLDSKIAHPLRSLRWSYSS
jgi:predicted O-methyltransferase YrrM